MPKATHTDRLGSVAEDLAIIQLSTLFEDCIVSQVVNSQLHDLEIRKNDEQLTKGICRIQVKSTNSRGRVGGHQYYIVGIHHQSFVKGVGAKKVTFETDTVDFFLFYVFPEGKFYVVPSDVARDKHAVKLYVGLPKPPQARGIYEKYLEAWWMIADFLGVPTEAQTTEAQTVLEREDIN